MVHRRKKKEVFVVSAFYGSVNVPYRESYIVFGKNNLDRKVAEIRKKGQAKNIHISRNGLSYIQGFTVVGGIKARNSIRRDKPNKIEVVWDK